MTEVMAKIDNISWKIENRVITIINAGKSRNEVMKVTANPALIIQPKSMTGLISLTTREPKPMIVVSAV